MGFFDRFRVVDEWDEKREVIEKKIVTDHHKKTIWSATVGNWLLLLLIPVLLFGGFFLVSSNPDFMPILVGMAILFGGIVIFSILRFIYRRVQKYLIWLFILAGVAFLLNVALR